MAKVTAPLLSFGASGSIGNAQTYASWRGINYARRYTIPANPRTTAQQLTRDLFRMLSGIWTVAPAALVAPWNLLAEGRQFTGQNRFMGDNTRGLRGDSDLANFVSSPGVRSGFPLASFDASTGSSAGEIDVTATAPAIPPDWSIENLTIIAFPDQTPTDTFGGPIVVETVSEAPYDATLTGLNGGDSYVVSAFLHWTKPNGDDAYGASQTVLASAAE